MGKNKTKSNKKNSKVVEEVHDEPEAVIDESEDDATVASVSDDEQDETKDEQTLETKPQETFQDVSIRFSDNISEVKKLISSLYKDYQILEKLHRREVKDARKNRRNKSGAKRDVKSGFNKPTPVPLAIAKLFDIEEGTLLARTVVTKMIYQYIKDNGLQLEEDKRRIKPDSRIKKLFQLEQGDELTFQNFQTHMKKLYPKVEKKIEAAETV
jgi:upstream activation factor subunit UAF30